MPDTYHIDTSIAPLGPVIGLYLREEIDRPFELLVRIRRPDGGSAPEPRLALEQDVVVTLTREGATSRRVTGMVLGVEEAGARGAEYALRIGPALSLLALERTSRIFQDKTVPQILEEVLTEALGRYGRRVELDLTDAHEPREYCVQWQETNLQFVERLMAEEGIAYAFDHSGDREVLQLRDANTRYPELSANAGARATFTALAVDAHDADLPEAVHALVPAVQLGRTKVSVRDRDWTGPRACEGQAGGADDRGRERESYEHGHGFLSIGGYDEGSRQYQKHDAARQAPLRLEAYRAPLRVLHGRSSIPALAPGVSFELVGHPEGLDGRYLVTRVEHGTPDADPGRIATINRFRCIPHAVPHRPARPRSKPRVASVELARVVGPAGEEIHTDVHGRIKVQFPWDRQGVGDERSSCWVRVAHRWAGAGFGTLHVPRIGMEVIVHYVHGDPERPIVTGALYHGDNEAPYAHPDQKTRSTIKSHSSIGGGGFNELRLEDAAGAEQVYLHAQRNLDEVVRVNHTTSVGGDQDNTVHNDQTQIVHGEQTETVHGEQTMKISGKRLVRVMSGFDETIDSTERRTIVAGVTENIFGDQIRSVAGDVSEIVIGSEDRAVLAGLEEAVQGDHTRVVLGSAQRQATGSFRHRSEALSSVTTAGSFNLVAPSFTFDGSPLMRIASPVILTFSNQHDWDVTGTHHKITSTKLVVFDLVMGNALAKVSKATLGYTLASLKLSLYGETMEMFGVAHGYGMWRSEYCATRTTYAGVTIGILGLMTLN